MVRHMLHWPSRDEVGQHDVLHDGVLECVCARRCTLRIHWCRCTDGWMYVPTSYHHHRVYLTPFAFFIDVPVAMTELNAASQSYRNVLLKFQNDWVKGSCPRADCIFEISSKGLEKRWKDYRSTLAQSGSSTAVEEHYHGTIIMCDLAGSKVVCSHVNCGICGISQRGFITKYIGKNISFKRFGHGFYLAPNSSKCHDYTQGIQIHRAMLLCDVLPGNKHVVTTDQTHLTAPPQGYDSVYGQPGSSLNYPEIVLYDEEAILPRYVIMYQKDGICKIAK